MLESQSNSFIMFVMTERQQKANRLCKKLMLNKVINFNLYSHIFTILSSISWQQNTCVII